MGVPKLSVRLPVPDLRSSLVTVLCLLALLSGPVEADSGSDRTIQVLVGSRQSMGFEYLREAPVLFGYGITADLMDQPITSLLNGAAAMRLNWIRQPIRWADIEPAEGVYAWERLDSVVSEVRIRGFHLLLAFDGTPTWADPELGMGADDGPPADLVAFGRFVAAVGARYAGLVDAYQIWQHPNTGVHWCGQPSPQAYRRLLQTAYQAVKAADPGALVVSGDVALGAPEPRPDAMNGLDFLTEMVGTGYSGTFDVLGVSLDPSAELSLERLRALEQLIGVAGEIPIWVTGAGSSCPQANGATATVCEERQADQLVELATSVADLGWVQAFMVDNFNLSIVDANHPDAGKSIMRPDWSPRPVFVKYAQMRQQQVVATEPAPTATGRNRAPQSGSKPHHLVAEK